MPPDGCQYMFIEDIIQESLINYLFHISEAFYNMKTYNLFFARSSNMNNGDLKISNKESTCRKYFSFFK